jgi:hypothetical protein
MMTWSRAHEILPSLRAMRNLSTWSKVTHLGGGGVPRYIGLTHIMNVLMLTGGCSLVPKNEMVSLVPVSKVQQMELYLSDQMLMLKHAKEYLNGNPFPRSNASHTCPINRYNQLDHWTVKCTILNHVTISWIRACEKQWSQRTLMTLSSWFKATTNDGYESKVHNPLS